MFKRDVRQQLRDIIIIQLLKELRSQLWLLYKKSTSVTESKYQIDFKILIQQVIIDKNILITEVEFNKVIYTIFRIIPFGLFQR